MKKLSFLVVAIVATTQIQVQAHKDSSMMTKIDNGVKIVNNMPGQTNELRNGHATLLSHKETADKLIQTPAFANLNNTARASITKYHKDANFHLNKSNAKINHIERQITALQTQQERALANLRAAIQTIKDEDASAVAILKEHRKNTEVASEVLPEANS